MNASHRSLRLSVDDPDARPLLDEAVAALARRDAPRLSVRLEGVELSNAMIGALVAALRRLRAAGGALEVVAGSDAIAAALELHGLDRVFAFPLDPERAGVRRFGLARVARAAATLFVLAAALAAGPARQARAAAEIAPADPAEILARVAERNPELASYRGRLHVDVKLQSFPFLHEHLDATTYYKRPSNYEVVFDRVPSYARGFEKLYSDIGDPARWAEHFVVTPDGERDVDGHRDVALRLVQRVRGMIDHETVLVDPADWHVDSIRYDYYNGGSITMTQRFRDVGGYSLLVSQRAVIAIPFVRATADASYDGYAPNVAVDDAVFTKSAK